MGNVIIDGVSYTEHIARKLGLLKPLKVVKPEVKPEEVKKVEEKPPVKKEG